jgi:hypothetical protein
MRRALVVVFLASVLTVPALADDKAKADATAKKKAEAEEKAAKARATRSEQLEHQRAATTISKPAAGLVNAPTTQAAPALGSKSAPAVSAGAAPTVRPTAVAPNGAAANAPAPSAGTATGEGTSQEAAKRVAATEVERWLALVDARRYADSWAAASSLFRQQITKDRWVAAVERARNTIGLLTSRRLASAIYTEESLAGSPGPFVVLRDQSAFQKLPDASDVLRHWPKEEHMAQSYSLVLAVVWGSA